MDLFTEFPSVTKAQWLAQIEKDLKGRSHLDLHWQEAESVIVDPFPHSEDLDWQPQALWASPGWEICEAVELEWDYKGANRQALEALEGGADALKFIFKHGQRSFPLFKVLLKDIDCSIVSTHFSFGDDFPNPFPLLRHLAKLSDTRHASLNWYENEHVSGKDIASMIRFAQEKLPTVKILTLAPTPSGKAVSELAELISKAARWLEILWKKWQIHPSTVNNHLQFSLNIENDFFLEIAKLRALRLLWANVLKGYGITEAVMPTIEATVFPYSEIPDPQKSMISSTTAAMSAILGGADRLTIMPSEANGQYSAAFYRRIARNVQHIIKVESHLDWVADPAAGSYFVEKLSEQLAEAAWAVFQGGDRFDKS